MSKKTAKKQITNQVVVTTSDNSKKNAGKKITIPHEVLNSDNLVDASTNTLELEVNPDGNLQPVETPETTEATESTEAISDEVATELIPANANNLETMVEQVVENNEPTTETVVEAPEVIAETLLANKDVNETMVEPVADSNETATETIVEVSEVIADNTENHELVTEGNEPIKEVAQVAEVEPKKSSKKKGDAASTIKRVKLVGTSYHYFRNILKYLFRENEIQSAKFIKNAVGWHGYISIAEGDKEQSLKVFAQYQIDNPDVKALWWDVSAN